MRHYRHNERKCVGSEARLAESAPGQPTFQLCDLEQDN